MIFGSGIDSCISGSAGSDVLMGDISVSAGGLFAFGSRVSNVSVSTLTVSDPSSSAAFSPFVGEDTLLSQCSPTQRYISFSVIARVLSS